MKASKSFKIKFDESASLDWLVIILFWLLAVVGLHFLVENKQKYKDSQEWKWQRRVGRAVSIMFCFRAAARKVKIILTFTEILRCKVESPWESLKSNSIQWDKTIAGPPQVVLRGQSLGAQPGDDPGEAELEDWAEIFSLQNLPRGVVNVWSETTTSLAEGPLLGMKYN